MFHFILLLVLAGATVQILRQTARSAAGAAEIILRWVLVGYCGVPMAAYMTYGLVHPVEIARMTGFDSGSPFQTFVMWALLGMAISAVLAIRGNPLLTVGPAISWAVFFVGATFIHLRQYSEAGALSHHALLIILVTHGLISLILLSTLWLSGAWREPGTGMAD